MNIPNLASRHQAIFSSWLNFFCCGWANTFTVNSNNKTIDKTFFMVCECYSLFKFRLIFCVKTTTSLRKWIIKVSLILIKTAISSKILYFANKWCNFTSRVEIERKNTLRYKKMM